MLWPLAGHLTMETEGVGFEPTVGFPTLDFESSALNRTQPPFQSLDIVDLISRCAIFGHAVCLQRRRRTRAFNGAMDVTLTDGGIETRGTLFSLFWVAVVRPTSATSRLWRRRQSITANRPPRTEKCYNFGLAMPERGAAYCMSQGQPTLLLVVHQDSQVVCAAVHRYSHIISHFN